VSGIILLVTASTEIAEDADDIGANHGISLFAVTQIIAVIQHLLHSAKELHKGREALGKNKRD